MSLGMMGTNNKHQRALDNEVGWGEMEKFNLWPGGAWM